MNRRTPQKYLSNLPPQVLLSTLQTGCDEGHSELFLHPIKISNNVLDVIIFHSYVKPYRKHSEQDCIQVGCISPVC